MKYDLESLSRAELVQLRADVEEAISSLAERERQAAVDAARKAAAEHGFDLADLAPDLVGKPRGKSRSKNPAKYRNPEDPSQTWTGRGRKPQWVKDAQEAGKDLSDLAI